MAEGFELNPLAAVQTGMGVVQALSNMFKKPGLKRKQKEALDAYEVFKTPKEVADLLAATQARAANGMGAQTLDYLTEQATQAGSATIGASLLLGGDANAASNAFDQKMNAMFKIGAENHKANIANFSQYLTAMGTVIDNRVAEQLSAQQKQKNYIQAASAELGQNTLGVQEGLNNIIGGVANQFTSDLYNEDESMIGEEFGSDAALYAKKNKLRYGDFKRGDILAKSKGAERTTWTPPVLNP